MLPAYVANMAPVLMKWCCPSLASPIDCNKKLFGKAIFGKNKTWRGLIFGVISGIIISFIQFLINYKPLELISYNDWLIFGFLMGLGAILGDLLGSMLKRQVGIAPGKKFIPVDQLDFVFGSLLLSYTFVPSWKLVLTICLISPFLHILTNHIAFFTKIRKEAW